MKCFFLKTRFAISKNVFSFLISFGYVLHFKDDCKA
jgi:hypothetical protein